MGHRLLVPVTVLVVRMSSNHTTNNTTNINNQASLPPEMQYHTHEWCQTLQTLSPTPTSLPTHHHHTCCQQREDLDGIIHHLPYDGLHDTSTPTTTRHEPCNEQVEPWTTPTTLPIASQRNGKSPMSSHTTPVSNRTSKRTTPIAPRHHHPPTL